MSVTMPDLPTYLTQQIDLALSEGRGFEALLLSTARDAVEMNDELLREIQAHRFDTAHLVKKLGHKGYRPRLADQMLYKAVGLDPVEVVAQRAS